MMYRENNTTKDTNFLIKGAGVQVRRAAATIERMARQLAETESQLFKAERMNKLSSIALSAARKGTMPYEEVERWVNAKMSEKHEPEYYAEIFRNAQDHGVAYSEKSSSIRTEPTAPQPSVRSGQLISEFNMI